LNARGDHWMFELVGHLKPGVTPAQATADLNSMDSYLKRSYPKKKVMSLIRWRGLVFMATIWAGLCGLFSPD
jgi:hypothetical protein